MIIAPTPTDAVFQQRRRRAAKLTQFFGVHYRDLMGEILERLERGLEEECGRGTLRPDEVQVRVFFALFRGRETMGGALTSGGV